MRPVIDPASRRVPLFSALLAVSVFSFIFDGYAIETPAFAVSPSNVLLGLSFAVGITLAVRGHRTLIPPLAARPYLALIAWIAGAEAIAALLGQDRSFADFRPTITWIGAGVWIWLIAVQSSSDALLDERLLGALAASMAVLALMTLGVFVGALPLPETGNFGSFRDICGVVLPGRALGTPLTFGYFGLLASIALPSLAVTIRGQRAIPVPPRLAVLVSLGIVAMAIFTASRSVWATSIVLMVTTSLLLLLRRGFVLWPVATLLLGLLAANFLLSCSILPRIPNFLSSEPRAPAVIESAKPFTLPGGISVTVPAAPAVAPAPREDVVTMDLDTIQARLASYRVAGELFVRQPIFGAGTVRMERASARQTGIGGPVHNKFIAQAGGTGLLGTIPLVLLWIIAAFDAQRLMRAPLPGFGLRGVAYLAAVFGMLAQLQFFGGESLKPAALLFALIAISVAKLDKSSARVKNSE